MRRSLTAAGMLVLLAPLWATAQDSPAGAAGQVPLAPGDAPLTTGRKPADIPTTTPQATRKGPDGDAPSHEVPAAGKATRTEDGTSGSTSAGQPPPGATVQQGVPHALTAGEAKALLGRAAVSADGAALGTIRDFVTSGTDGRVRQVVLGRHGVAGVGETLVAVPAEAMALDPAAAADKAAPVTLRVPKAEVEARPPFHYEDRANVLVGPPGRRDQP
jgi:hypothetical protein